MNNILKISILALSLVGVVAGCNSCRSGKNCCREEKSHVKVKVQEIASVKASTSKTYVGKVKSGTDITVKASVPGTLEKLSASQGRKVGKDEELAYIFSETVNSSYEAACASLAQAQDAYDRIQSVKADGSVSELKQMEVATKLSQARSTYNSAAHAMQNCHVKASLAGTVSEVFVKEGEDVSLLQPLVRIIDLSDLEIEIAVPETEIATLGIGDQALIEIPALPGCHLKGVLEKKGVNASSLSHNYTCTLDITEYPQSIMPGMIGRVRFESQSEDYCHIIPVSAVCSDKSGRYVWLVSGGDKVEKRYVTTGDFASEGIIITSGLKDADRLIVEGMSKISTGMTVSIE